MQWMQQRLPTSWDSTLSVIVIGTFKQRVPQVETDFTRASIGSLISSKMPIANWNIILSTFSCYINIIKSAAHLSPPWKNNNINRGNTKCKPRDLFDLEVEGGDCRKLSLCQEVFGGRGVGKSAGSTHCNGHTRLLPCATYYYNYYYISIIVTLFTQRYHEKSGKLGSNCIKVPNSETYNTLWLINNLNIFGKKT